VLRNRGTERDKNETSKQFSSGVGGNERKRNKGAPLVATDNRFKGTWSSRKTRKNVTHLNVHVCVEKSALVYPVHKGK
jgi:hypothetical protein